MKKTKLVVVLLLIIVTIGGIILTRSKEENRKVVQNKWINTTKIILYFSNLEKGELVKEYRYVNIEDIKNDMGTTIIKELLKGPENEELVSCIPMGTKLNSILLEKEKIIIDFSKEFKEENNDEIKGMHKIYSVVNSLTEITEINEVEIRIEGEFFTSKVRL